MQQGTSVILRLRPLVDRETENAWDIDDSNIQVLPTKRAFTQQASNFVFPQIIQQKQTTLELYEQYLVQISQNVVEGVNSTLLAYGQSSAGKTFTMFGSDRSKGVIELILTDIFAKVKNTSFLVKLQFVELYNEVLVDLLSSTKKQPVIREDQGQILLQNVEEPKVTSYEDCCKLIVQGQKNRTTSETNLNEQSSRSHAILRIVLEQSDLPSLPTKRKTFRANKSSVLTLVDLAGSEKQSKTNAQGIRLNEANSINKSLLTLGVVINALATKQQFVPYRDSKLTRLLQNSLGGNALSYIIGCVSPATEHIDESINTMRFCQRAMKVENKAKVNEFYTDAEKLERALQQNKLLKQKIKDLEEQVGVYSASVANMTNLSVSELDNSQVSRTSLSELSLDQLNEPAQKIIQPTPGTREIELERQINEMRRMLEIKDQENQQQLDRLRQKIEDTTTDQILLVTQKYQEDFDQQQKLDQQRIEDLLLMVDTLQKQINAYMDIEMVSHSVQLTCSQLEKFDRFAQVGQSLLEFCVGELAIQKDVSRVSFSCQQSSISISEHGEQVVQQVSDKDTSYSIKLREDVCSISIQTSVLQEIANARGDQATSEDVELINKSALVNVETIDCSMNVSMEEQNSAGNQTSALQVNDATAQADGLQQTDALSIQTSAIQAMDVSNQYGVDCVAKQQQTSFYQNDVSAGQSLTVAQNQVQTSNIGQNSVIAQTSLQASVSCQCSGADVAQVCLQTSCKCVSHGFQPEYYLKESCQSSQRQLYSSNVSEHRDEQMELTRSRSRGSPFYSSPLRRMQRESVQFQPEETVGQIFAHFMQDTQPLTSAQHAGLQETEVCACPDETCVLQATVVQKQLQETLDAPEACTIALTAVHSKPKEQNTSVQTGFLQDKTDGAVQAMGNVDSFGAQVAVEGQNADHAVQFLGDQISACVQNSLAVANCDAQVSFEGDLQSKSQQASVNVQMAEHSAMFYGVTEDVGTSVQEQEKFDQCAECCGDTTENCAQTEECQTRDNCTEVSTQELAEIATMCRFITSTETQTELGEPVSKQIQTETCGCEKCAAFEAQLKSEVAAQKQRFQAQSDEITLLHQQSASLQNFIAEMEARFDTQRMQLSVENAALSEQKQVLENSLRQIQEQLSAIQPPLACSANMQTDVNDISKSIQVYTSMVLSQLTSSLTVDNSVQLADAATEMTVAGVLDDIDYRERYFELEAKFNRLIADSREKIQFVMDSAKKREEHLLEKVKEQLGEMKKYKDVVLQLQEKQALSQKMRFQQQMVGMQAPKQPE